ncbi:amino acid ABC transporter permease, partial [Mesorhizobium sp. P5_C1]
FNISLIFPSITITIPWGPTLYSVPTNAVITGFTAALLGLGLNEGAYMSEIVRAGLLSVDRGQLEAAQALGFTRMKTLWEVVLPQAMRIIIPPTGNQLISMLKTTALVSVIAGGDLLTKAQNLYSMNFLVLELLVVASIWYIVLTTIASWAQSYLERRLEAAHGNAPTFRSSFLNWRKLSDLMSGGDHDR